MGQHCGSIAGRRSFFVWRASSEKAIDSLAVLPFVNVGGDPNTEYLSDGITENLINSFSRLPKLRVVPRSLAFSYKGREIDPRKAGRDLNVRAVLMGRVVQRGDSLNVQTELVDVAEVSQLWGQQYNRTFSEIVPVQDEIARAVSEKLRLRPTDEEQRRITKHYTENAELISCISRAVTYGITGPETLSIGPPNISCRRSTETRPTRWPGPD